MLRAFFGSEISPIEATLPGLFAKLSLVWPALFTLFDNIEFSTITINLFQKLKLI